MKKSAFLLIAAMLLTITSVFADSVPRMSIDELKSMLESDDVVILDVRAGRDWSTSEFKIPGAIRAGYDDFETWSEQYPKEKKIVLYCA